MARHGNYSQAGEFHYREMEMKRKRYKVRQLRWWSQNVLRLLCGYGERPKRVIAMSLIIILSGAIAFFFCGVTYANDHHTISAGEHEINYSLESISLTMATASDFVYCTYLSVVTFTTLGYGDICPSGYGRIFASLEAFAGAFFMALFVLVFGRKMIR
jgi:hypothetical protein